MIDSGASFHATSNKELLKNYIQGDIDKVFLGVDKPHNIVGKGDVLISLPNEGTWMLNDVQHVPYLKRNLISVGQLTSLGYNIIFIRDSWKITKGLLVIAYGKKEGILYLTKNTFTSISITVKNIDSDI